MQQRVSPMGGAKPTTADLARFAGLDTEALLDVLPADGTRLRLLIVGINPGLWTAAVNAPFARPGNRFWPSLHRAGMTSRLVDASRGLDPADEADLLQRGIGITNLVGRATVRADELTRDELQDAGARLVARVQQLRPAAVAIAGITAFRAAYRQPKAVLGRQDASLIDGWPSDTELWVVPQPSGLNAHENIESLAGKWRVAWSSAGVAAAMRAVPRAEFLPAEQRDFAAVDAPLPIGEGQTNSQPGTVSIMLGLLGVQPGDRVLDVGSGSGWTTALLSHLVGEEGTVIGIERHASLADASRAPVARHAIGAAEIRVAEPGVLGLPRAAPFDRILVSAGADRMPEELIEQLADTGVMVVPVAGQMLRIVRDGDQTLTDSHGLFRFVPLVTDP